MSRSLGVNMRIYILLFCVGGCLEARPPKITTSTPPVCQSAIEPAPVDYGYPLDDTLRLNHVQAKGTHNSYHIETPGTQIAEHQYTHEPLDVGLAQLGLRQFELDIHQDDELDVFTVFHIPLLDELSTCHLFTECLSVMKVWSDDNPGHAPIIVWVEPKDDLDAEQIEDYDRLDEEIRSVWPQERLFTPDDLQRGYGSIKESLAAEGWPTLGELRDRIILIMLDDEQHMLEYTRELTSLRCRSMFVNQSDFDSDFASFVKINDPTNVTRISEAISKGLIVTSNVDAADNTDEENASRAAQGLANGVHFFSSDLPAPTPDRAYFFDIPDGAPLRCNPVTAPANCQSEAIEELPRP